VPDRDYAVSAIIPVYNGERFLGDAVESVRRQTRPPSEVIIVDDGSTDATPAVAGALGEGIRYVRQANAGPSAARNHGLRLATGAFVAFLDADDLWTENKLACQLACFEADPRLDVVMGTLQLLHWCEEPDGTARLEIGPGPWPAPSFGSGLFRRSAFDRVGLVEESQRFGEDLDWFFRAVELGLRVRVIPEVAQYYRRHDRNMTNDHSASMRFFVRALKRSLDRRRRAGARALPMPDWLSGTVRLIRDGYRDPQVAAWVAATRAGIGSHA
jgi:glycosyltransferase involved in cell wall biosynthesis